MRGGKWSCVGGEVDTFLISWLNLAAFVLFDIFSDMLHLYI